MNALAKWHQTKSGLITFVIIELATSYGFASLAIDTGNLLWYLLFAVFLIGAAKNLLKLIGRLLHVSAKS
jgi:hypothetical protein